MPALLPLIQHQLQEVRDAVQAAVIARLETIALPTDAGHLPGWSTKHALSENLGKVDAGLARLVIDENRLELLPAALSSRAAKLLRDLQSRAEMNRVNPTLEGHQLILMAAARSAEDELTPATVRRLTAVVVQYRYPPQALAALTRHGMVDDDLLEDMLLYIIQKGRRTIDQARTLSAPCFPHERAGFRRVMAEAYRLTIGSPHLVQAVFMATPPEALQEALEFLLVNHARGVLPLVRRWIDRHPDDKGRVSVRSSTLFDLARDPDPEMRVAAEMLRRVAAPRSESAKAKLSRSRGVDVTVSRARHRGRRYGSTYGVATVTSSNASRTSASASRNSSSGLPKPMRR